MDSHPPEPDYKKLFLQAEAQRKQAEAQRKQAEAQRKQAEAQRKQLEEDLQDFRNSTLVDFLKNCHELLLSPLKVNVNAKSTAGTICPPKGKFCPMRLELWEDCPSLYQRLYDSARRYIQPLDGDAPLLFSSRFYLQQLSLDLTKVPLRSERKLESYEYMAVNMRAREILAELSKIPAAREELKLGAGVDFPFHKNLLEESEEDIATDQKSSTPRPRADEYCINIVDETTEVLVAAIEYKSPHKLSTATIRLGLRPMNLWEDVVLSNIMPSDPDEKLKSKAEQLVCSAIVQQYHVMIQEGLEVSGLTNGFCDIHLRISHDEPETLYYYVFDPCAEIAAAEDADDRGSMTMAITVPYAAKNGEQRHDIYCHSGIASQSTCSILGHLSLIAGTRVLNQNTSHPRPKASILQLVKAEGHKHVAKFVVCHRKVSGVRTCQTHQVPKQVQKWHLVVNAAEV
ncbi:hypothetical protein E4U53_002363 [Claviceps sorghi]|nr:hypothetical protein E4U53_002363 [Claviceps sorghi]